MDISELRSLRLKNQCIIPQRFKKPSEVLRHMGAMQAQDLPMVKWALGLRTKGTITEKHINQAIESGDILRTHLLRPTWHLVVREDIRWMIRLTAPRIRTSMRSRHRQLGITPKLIDKSNSLLLKFLQEREYADRNELVEVLEKNKIDTGDNRASHLLICAELEEVICSGPLLKGPTRMPLWTSGYHKWMITPVIMP